MAGDPDLDRYDAWYARKLWELLPAIYRAEDSTDFDRRGPLEELVARIGAQAAVVRRSVDRLWEDQSIETCDDWVIPYIGDLVATNLVSGLGARGQRVDVFKTIHYRRRKGTVALLEELATDITGWSARVVEMFRRLARSRHRLDPAVGVPTAPADPWHALERAQGLIGARTRTGAGGLADLRDVPGAAMAGSAFDEYAHTADVRRGRGRIGWYDIPRVGVFVWRLKVRMVEQVTPVADTRCTHAYAQYTFDPTGRDVPLFARGAPPSSDEWVSPQPHQVPGPISPELMVGAFDALYPDSVRLYHRSVPDYAVTSASDVAADPRQPAGRPWIDPVLGRTIWPVSPPSEFRTAYVYAFSSDLGAGTYDRSTPGVPVDASPSPLLHVTDPTIDVLGAPSTGTVVIENSLTYRRVADVGGIDRVVLRARNKQRPLVRPKPAVAAWTFTGNDADATLVLDGVFVSGGTDVVIAGRFDRVTLSCCTFDPGSWEALPKTGEPRWRAAADGRELAPSRLRITARIRELVIDRSILGPISIDAGGDVESMTIRESIVQAARPGDRALIAPSGEVALSRVTLLGPAAIHRLDASECILHEDVQVADRQHGCVRFSAYTEASALPRRYESVPIAPAAGLFASRDFGQPAYAQLLATSGAIAEGAEDGSEMGAFWREKNAVKERSLLIKYQEYLPLGLEPVVVHVT